MAWKDIFQPAIEIIHDVIGDEITYTPDGGSPVLITAMHENEGQIFGDENTGAYLVGAQRTFAILKTDIAEPAKGDTILFDGVTYVVDIVLETGTDQFETKVVVVEQ